MSRKIDTGSTTQIAKIMVSRWRSSGSSWTKFIRTPTCRPLVGRTDGEWNLNGKKYRIGNVYLFIQNKDCSYTEKRGWHQNRWKEAEYGSHAEEIDEKCWSWWTNIISWPCEFGMHSTWMQAERKSFLMNTGKCSTHEFLLQQLKYYHDGTKLTQKRSRGHVIWKDTTRKSALRGFVNRQTKRQSNSTKSQLFAWMTIISRRRKLKRWEN